MFENAEVRNRRGERIDVAYHPGSKKDRLVILGHGVTGNKDRPLLTAVAEGLSGKGWPCLRISFSGNGDSEGDFRKATVTKGSKDLQDVLDQVPEGIEVAYAGHSMGAAAGLLTAEIDPRLAVLVHLAGMIRTEDFCEAEFGDVTPDEGCMWDDPDCPLSQSYVDDMASHGDLFDQVAGLDRPLLLIHGTDDDVVLPADSEDAFEVGQEPKQLVRIDGEGHSFSADSYPQIIDVVSRWLDDHL